MDEYCAIELNLSHNFWIFLCELVESHQNTNEFHEFLFRCFPYRYLFSPEREPKWIELFSFHFQGISSRK